MVIGLFPWFLKVFFMVFNGFRLFSRWICIVINGPKFVLFWPSDIDDDDDGDDDDDEQACS